MIVRKELDQPVFLLITIISINDNKKYKKTEINVTYTILIQIKIIYTKCNKTNCTEKIHKEEVENESSDRN